jgi:hypothetical protein
MSMPATSMPSSAHENFRLEWLILIWESRSQGELLFVALELQGSFRF